MNCLLYTRTGDRLITWSVLTIFSISRSLDKARDGLKINGGTLHWIAGTHRCFVGDEKLTKGIVFVLTYDIYQVQDSMKTHKNS